MPPCKRKRIKGRALNMLAVCLRFPLVADLPEFNKLLLPVANINIVPDLAQAVDVQTMQMITAGNHSKAWQGKRQREKKLYVNTGLHPGWGLLGEE